MFPNYSLKHYSHTIFNHCPLLVDTYGWVYKQRINSHQVLFEIARLLEQSCEVEVSQLWAQSMGSVLQGILYVRRNLME